MTNPIGSQSHILYALPGQIETLGGAVQAVGSSEDSPGVPVVTAKVDSSFVIPNNFNFLSLVAQAQHGLTTSNASPSTAMPAEPSVVLPTTPQAEVKFDREEMLSALKGGTAECWYDALIGGRLAVDVVKRFDELETALDLARKISASPKFSDKPSPDAGDCDSRLANFAQAIYQKFSHIDPGKRSSAGGRTLRSLSYDKLLRVEMSGTPAEEASINTYLFTDDNQKKFRFGCYDLSSLTESLFDLRHQAINRGEKGNDLKDSAENALRLIHSMIQDINATKNKSA